MTEPLAHRTGSYPSRAAPEYAQGSSSTNLADILERVLDKGIVIAGDIRINLLDIELLTVKLRLLVASVDKAKEMGIDWWEHDPSLSSRASQDGTERSLAAENRRLRAEIDALRGEGSLPGRAEEPLEAPRSAEAPRSVETPRSVEAPPSAVESGGGREPVERREDREGRGRRDPGEEQERGARRQRPEREARPTTRDRREARDRSERPNRSERPERRGTRDDDR
ncbi:gas vesicle protein GvpJ [Streptomyces pristinaespiralis]|uniref:Gas vesicle synthesis protein n=1 Tax=Streptomyces pristinaespiralis (strain ATCC 25486 / DSM 40338 / CBS 914.69 / JCM 4507 / KCC S-0507 / NBRC 13074 / NRRL 2958 / 5647) TaxID=457429 RepID=B5H6B6_STRE2|nr:gas vesicle synthesis protein [Streptomyces pristinaespiralis ATCC 25486]